MSNKTINKILQDKKTIAILDKLIVRYRRERLSKIKPECNDFGNPALNFLYIEIYKCNKNGQVMLGLAGSGIFLEELLNQLWASSQLHKSQLKKQFNTWDETMAFLEEMYEKIENNSISYKEKKVELLKIIEPNDFESMELLRDFIRNTYIHSKRARIIKALSGNGIIPKQAVANKQFISDKGTFVNVEVQMSQTHPLVRNLGFSILAKQLAPAMLIFVYDMFKKYHKYLAPLRDDKIKFPGHECKYD